MKWKKEKLLENLEKLIFLDEYGLCNIRFTGLSVNNIDFHRIFVYVPKNKRYEKPGFDNHNLSELITTLFEKQLATRQQPQNRGYYYGYDPSTPFTEAEASVVKVKSIKISLSTNFYRDLNSGRTENRHDEIELDKEKDFDKYECWVGEYENERSLQLADLSSLREKDELYYVGEGKVIVSKVYEFPNKKNIVCDVVNSDGKAFSIPFSLETHLYQLPYKNKKTILDEVDDAKNELLLSPFISMEGSTYNIYWKNVPEAARYIVSLYKYYEQDKRRTIHIADFDIDRNTCYLALNNLVGSCFIFKVSAEDRNGKTLAKSRGLTKGFPKYIAD